MQTQIKKDFNNLKITTNVNVEFNIYKYVDNVFTLVLNYTLIYVEENEYNFELEENTIYNIVLVDAVELEPESFKNYSVFVGNFDKLLKELSNDFTKFLCNNCNDYVKNDCNPCGNSNNLIFLQKFNTLTSKFLYYKSFIFKIYTNEEINVLNNFIYLGVNTLSCKLKKHYDLLIKEECLNGSSNNIELYKLLISINYLSLYFLEYYNNINIQENIDELYNIEKIKECLCNTCFRFEELKEIFENNDINIPTDPININDRPNGENIFKNIRSYNSLFELNLTPQMFTETYADDNTSAPVNIVFNQLLNGVLVDINGNVVTNNTTINFINIGNYKLIFDTSTSLEPNTSYEAFTFYYNDGNSNSSLKTFSVNLYELVDRPPIVKEGIETTFNNEEKIFTKFDFFNSNIVSDFEGDLVRYLRLNSFNSNDLKVYYKNDIGNFVEMSLMQEIDFKDYSNLSEIIKIEKLKDSSNNLEIVFDYRSENSNSFSSDLAPLNVLKVKFVQDSILDVSGFFIIHNRTTTEQNWRDAIISFTEGTEKVTENLFNNDLINGKTYVVNANLIAENICKFTFAINTDSPNSLKVYNLLGEVTDRTFETYYDSVNKIMYFTSLNSYVDTSNLYYEFKFN